MSKQEMVNVVATVLVIALFVVLAVWWGTPDRDSTFLYPKGSVCFQWEGGDNIGVWSQQYFFVGEDRKVKASEITLENIGESLKDIEVVVFSAGTKEPMTGMVKQVHWNSGETLNINIPRGWFYFDTAILIRYRIDNIYLGYIYLTLKKTSLFG